MKKLILFCLLSLFALYALGQEHLSFKGIPIEGSIVSFCQKLKTKGLTQIATDTNIRLFTGDFTGRNATIGVVADQSGQNVFAVVVIFDKSKQWNDLVNTYDHYKDLYTEKYGTPIFSREYNPSRSDSNTSLMYEVHQGTIEYGSVFSAPGGTIELSIDKADGIYEGQVIIRYKDSKNIDNKRKLDLDEI